MRQQELDVFRKKLGLEQWTIDKTTKCPFSESLKEYSRINNLRYSYHVEMEYHDDDMVTVSMTFKNTVIKISGKVESQDIYFRDALDDLQDEAAKKIIKKVDI
jgi:hypothetical protein